MDPDEVAHKELPHLDPRCLQKLFFNTLKYKSSFKAHLYSIVRINTHHFIF